MGYAMIHLAVVEDDKVYQEQLYQFLDRFKNETQNNIVVSFFGDGEDITEEYKSEYDIILMDIQMRFMDGMTAARQIRKLDEKVIIIFITSMTNYAIQGYEVGALDYILKPLSYPVFSQKLSRAITQLKTKKEHFVLISFAGGARRIEVSDIYYIESLSHTMVYHTADGTWEARGRLDDLETDLKEYGFYRSNRGYLVNLYHVSGVADGCCVVHGEKLSISRRKKIEFIEEMARIL